MAQAGLKHSSSTVCVGREIYFVIPWNESFEFWKEDVQLQFH